MSWGQTNKNETPYPVLLLERIIDFGIKNETPYPAALFGRPQPGWPGFGWQRTAGWR
jgi:hypothetical protein